MRNKKRLGMDLGPVLGVAAGVPAHRVRDSAGRDARRHNGARCFSPRSFLPEAERHRSAPDRGRSGSIGHAHAEAGRYSQTHFAPAALLRQPPVEQLELEELAAVEMIPDQLAGQVDLAAGGRHPVSHLPGHAIEPAAIRIG